MRLWIWGLVAAACGRSPAPSPSVPSDRVTPIEAIDAGAVAVADASVEVVMDAVAPGDAPPPPAVGEPRPALKGTVTSLRSKRPANVGGIAVELMSSAHKHPIAGGRSRGMWRFTARRGGKTQTIDLGSGEEGFEAEVVVHGALLVFRHVGYTEFEVVLVAARAPRPWTEDTCVERFMQRAAQQGRVIADHSASDEHGIVYLTGPDWAGRCGRYTKRMWFEARR